MSHSIMASRTHVADLLSFIAFPPDYRPRNRCRSPGALGEADDGANGAGVVVIALRPVVDVAAVHGRRGNQRTHAVRRELREGGDLVGAVRQAAKGGDVRH